MKTFTINKRNTVIEIIASLFIVLFVYTALSKFYEHESFKAVLRKSPLIGNFNTIVAWVIPLSEVAVSVFLVLPKTRIIGMFGAFILMSVFTLYLGYILAFTDGLPCSCGGVIRQMTWTQHFIFNIFFTLLALAGIWLNRKQPMKPKEQTQPVIFT